MPTRKQVLTAAALILAVRIVGFLTLGTARAGNLFGHFSQVAACIVAIGCCFVAAQRGRGQSRLFWALFGSAFALQLIADVGWTYCIYFNIAVPENALFPSLFYRLYAVPMAILLFLSEGTSNSKLETFLDGCIVVGLVGLCMYQVQMAELKTHDPHMGQLITMTAVVNAVLLLAAVVRFTLSTPGELHKLFGRLTAYLAIYSSVALATSYVDSYLPGIDDAFDQVWLVTYLAAAALAIRWIPSAADSQPGKPRISRRAASLCFNLTMAMMVVGSAVLGLGVFNASRIVGLIALALVLFSYAVRFALMQEIQEKNLAALRQSNTRYECVSLATNDVLWDRDITENTVSWNDNVYSLFGYRPEDVNVSRDWWISNLHPEDREQVLSSVTALLAGDRNAWSGEYRFRRADGSYAFVFDRAYVVRNEHGIPLRIIGSIQDLTVRKQAEMEIEQARRAAEAAARAKSNFLSNMSHEIRTPLNGILGMLELAQQTKLTPEQKEVLALARESADGLFLVVNDVLDFSKIEAGRMELEHTEFDVADTVAEAARTVLVHAHQKHLDLSYSVAANAPHRAIGDPGRLKQVLVNLLGNAVKFTNHGQIVLRVETDIRNNSEAVLRFSVADTGIGIPAEKQETIFQAFSQADNSITRKFGGTGLGLAISSKLVSLMKGRIWVESKTGKGSTFYFTARFGLNTGTAAVPSPRPSSAHATRILIVDSHSTSRAFLSEILGAPGAEVIAVATGEQALENFTTSREGDFNLLLCDSELPGMDCFELVARVRQSSAPSPGIILMLTSKNYQGEIARCREMDITTHLIKPFKKSELLSLVERILRGSDGHNELQSAVPAKTEEPQHLNILLAEDNLVNQKVAVKMLQRLGHRVEVAENGRAALERAKSEAFDLILMDGHMPEMDGLAATRAIREWEGSDGPHIPIIAMTAMAMEGDRENFLKAGMDAFIAKPITMVALKTTIQQVMEVAGKKLFVGY